MAFVFSIVETATSAAGVGVIAARGGVRTGSRVLLFPRFCTRALCITRAVLGLKGCKRVHRLYHESNTLTDLMVNTLRGTG